MKQQWWHDKVAYQIYPKSFCDSNGDGIGDLRGILSKLDYLKELGVDILWLSPCYLSPMADQGYDIADYYRIDPRFGTMEDMEALIAAAKERGMVILMDLVVNHCSDEHEWFRAACADPDGKYGKYFYLADKAPDGKLPCNWRSYFGGPVWDELPGTDKLYLHVFHKKQPDLNWENPEVREEVYRNIGWWMDKGLAGFRIDAIINIKKPAVFHDYPVDGADGLSSVHHMLAEAEGVGDFLGELRDRAFAPTNAFTVGEVFDMKEGELANFIGDHGYFSTMFDFRSHIACFDRAGWHRSKPIDADTYKRCCFASQRESAGVGFYANVIENHDEPRGVSCYLPPEGRTPQGKMMLGALNFLLRGIPFLFQGQELGMENWAFDSIDEVDDVNTRDQYATALRDGCTEAEALAACRQFSRDNARTPMQWTAGPQAGFTTGTPWLPVNPNHTEINAETELADPDSVFHFYQKLIALRKHPDYKQTLVYGDTIPVWEDEPGLMAYHRKGDRDLLVIGNFCADGRTVTLPADCTAVLLDNYGGAAPDGRALTLKPFHLVVLELRS